MGEKLRYRLGRWLFYAGSPALRVRRDVCEDDIGNHYGRWGDACPCSVRCWVVCHGRNGAINRTLHLDSRYWARGEVLAGMTHSAGVLRKTACRPCGQPHRRYACYALSSPGVSGTFSRILSPTPYSTASSAFSHLLRSQSLSTVLTSLPVCEAIIS